MHALQLQNVTGKELRISYPCVVLNVMVAKHQTNPQYATLEDAAEKRYTTSSEMSIEFEVDGPYKVRAGVWLQILWQSIVHLEGGKP